MSPADLRLRVWPVSMGAETDRLCSWAWYSSSSGELGAVPAQVQEEERAAQEAQGDQAQEGLHTLPAGTAAIQGEEEAEIHVSEGWETPRC